MRGREKKQSSMLCLLSPADRVPRNHPLRQVKALADEILGQMSPTFDAMYAEEGRPSIPPETLLKASLLIAFYSVRSERQFCEQLDYNLMFRWFLDMDMTAPGFDASTFSKNRERLMAHDVAGEFFRRVVEAARAANLMSREHFTVDGTLIEAWASLKSFKPKSEDNDRGHNDDDPGNPSVNFHGETRRNDTHESKTDPQARLMRKGNGKEAKLTYGAHALMENRNGLLADVLVTESTHTEVGAALELLVANQLPKGATIGGDRGYNTRAFVKGCRALGLRPHVAQKVRHSAIDGRTARHAGYAVSQRLRKRVEEIFGWGKTVGGIRKTKLKGIDRNQAAAYIVGAAYNLVRLIRLTPTPA